VRLVIGAGACAAALGGAGPAATAGDAEAGRAVFADKGCTRCHLPAGWDMVGPPLEALRRPQGELELAGRLWNHVPDMLAAVAREAVGWPRISPVEMADLMTYLRAEAVRDPEPDLYKGQLALLRKGCLKCHSLRKEGGPVRPDLAERRTEYASAAVWAAAMWTHTPGMLAMAGRQGIPYPRFSGDEMGNLLGFLRYASGSGPARPPGQVPGR
jgi:cytochrome c551/c552